LSDLLRAWYVLLVLGLITFALTALVGKVPLDITSAISLPHNLPYRVGVNLREAAVGLADRRAFQSELERLKNEVETLREENRGLVLEIERLGQLLEVRTQQSPGAVMSVPVVGVGSGSVFERLELGQGARSGVVRDMPVVVPAGLVGIVTDVSATRALVRTITDPESRVGVTVRGKGGRGIAIGEVSGRIRVTGYRAQSALERGDLVETASEGGLFPRGVLVGVIDEVFPADPNDLQQTFMVRPAVDLSTLLEVILISPS